MKQRIRHLVIRGLAALGVALGIALALPTAPAPALTGNDGLIAIATDNGIEVFDSSGDGSDLHVLIPSGPGLSLLEPAWSPTGDRIAYTAWTNQGRSLWIARADGSHARRISALDENGDDEAAWSPDGRIAFLRTGSTVVITDPDGSHQVVIDPRAQLGRPNVYTLGRPVWTADGRLVVRLQEPGVIYGPYIADADGQNLRPLRTPSGEWPAYTDLSSTNWQFSSTGLVAYRASIPEDDWVWVHFSTFDGRHIVEAPGYVDADLGGGTDVALGPSGQRAVRVWNRLNDDPLEASVGVRGVDLTQPNPFTPEFGFTVPGDVNGLDWQPRCSIIGTPGDDILTGTPGPDLICGLGGIDTIRGRRGNDVIYAGGGDDAVSGGWGNDVLVGGPGADTIEGNRERDVINSRRDTRAADTVDGGLGHNVCLHDRVDSLTSC